MKKILMVLFSLITVMVLTACGTANNSQDKNSESDEVTSTETNSSSTETASADAVEDDMIVHLHEPDENSVCEMCNMKVYEKTDTMGMFSAQAIKEDGSTSFYDDIGCLLNAELKFNETNRKYVRDFNTLDWVLVDDAVIVKADIKTPMNWGYAFFKEEADAQKFIEENEGAHIEQLATVTQLAKERFEAKQKQQQQGQQGNMNMQQNQDHGNMNGHN